MSKFFRILRYDLPLHFVFLLTNWLPDNTPFLRLRGWLASFFLGSCGKNLRLGRHISFYNPAMISLGRDVYIAYGCWFMAGAQITVADEVLFGPYSVVVSSNHTRKNHSYRYGTPQKVPINIGSGTWISAHVTITGGGDIGAGSLVAAGAVVNGKIPGNTLAGGIPAKVLKPIADE